MWKWAWLGAVLLVALVTAGPAVAATVREFQLESNLISRLAQAADGTILYSASHQVGKFGNGFRWLGYVGRVGQEGPLGETAVPPSFPGDIAVGSEGNTYLAPSTEGIVRLTPSGEWSRTAARQNGSEEGVAPAAGGGVWFVQRDDRDGDTVGRISASGQVSEFPIPTKESGASAIVEGHEGDAWFTEYFADKIGRVTPSGQITEFPIREGMRPWALAVDGEGNIWFTGPTSSSIGRVSPDGSVAMFPLPNGVAAGAVAAGPDGRIWFTEARRIEPKPHYSETTRGIGRITPIGNYSEVRLPDKASDPVDLIAGAEGNVWYAAMGEGPCRGGGGSCMLWKPANPAIVGRITPGPLRVAVPAGEARVWRNRVNAPISCSEGVGSDVCRGAVEIEIEGRTLARSPYILPVDKKREVAVKRLGPASSLLRASAKRHRAVIVLRPETGKPVRREVSLIPQHRPDG